MEKTVGSLIQFRRGTTEEWKNSTRIPKSGEPCYNSDTGVVKVGNGVDLFKDLPEIGGGNATHYEGVKIGKESDTEVIERVLTALSVEANTGDVFIVKTLIVDDKYSYTAYVYNGENWTAMDGNYSSDNVYFKDNMTVTTTVGTITELENGSATFETAGKSLTQVLNALLAEEKNPEVDMPSVTFTTSNQTGEVGSTYIIPTAIFKVNDVGSYTYGSKDANNMVYLANDTGIIFATGDVNITCDKGGSVSNTEDLITNSTLSLKPTSSDVVLFADNDIKYTFSVTAQYTESDRIPVTNLGNTVDELKINTGSLEVADCVATITGWRKMFFGSLTDASTTITSDVIRALSLVNKQVSTSSQTFTVPVGAKKVVLACPDAYKVSKVEYFTMSWEIFSDFVQIDDVEVADARGRDNGLTTYNVYTYTPASAFEAATQFRVTLKKV